MYLLGLFLSRLPAWLLSSYWRSICSALCWWLCACYMNALRWFGWSALNDNFGAVAPALRLSLGAGSVAPVCPAPELLRVCWWSVWVVSLNALGWVLVGLYALLWVVRCSSSPSSCGATCMRCTGIPVVTHIN